MDPKHLMVKQKSLGESSAKQCATKIPCRARRVQIQAQEEANFFKDHIPLSICQEVKDKVKDLWYTVKNIPKEDLHQEVVDWVLDPGTTAGHATTYNRLLVQYWVNMKMVGHSYMEQEAKKEGDEEPIKSWKFHNADVI